MPIQKAQINLAKFIDQIAPKQIFIAFSGGADSMFLLESAILVTQNKNIKLIALHINHGLNKKSNAWEEFCCNYCLKRQVEFRSFKLNLKYTSDFETIARQARYKIFAEQLTIGDILLTGHHQNDQIETLLLNLFRGTGNLGLAAMPAVRSFGLGYLARPLLDITKDQIYAYLRQEKITWIEDESNADTNILRNFVRWQVLPLVKSRYKDIETKLALTCANAQSTQTLLEELASEDFFKVITADFAAILKKRLGVYRDCAKNSNSISFLGKTPSHILQNQFKNTPIELDISQLQLLSQVRVNNLMRFIAKLFNLGDLPKGFFQQLTNLLNGENINLIAWENHFELRTFKNLIFLGDKKIFAPFDTNLTADWNGIYPLPEIFLRAQAKFDLSLPKANYQLRARRGGENIFYRKKNRKVKKLLQAMSIPAWQRDRQIFVYQNNKLLAVGNLIISDDLSSQLHN